MQLMNPHAFHLHVLEDQDETKTTFDSVNVAKRAIEDAKTSCYTKIYRHSSPWKDTLILSFPFTIGYRRLEGGRRQRLRRVKVVMWKFTGRLCTAYPI